MQEGTVKLWKVDRGYGFITPDGGGHDVFVHISALRGRRLIEGERVQFELGATERGACATYVMRLVR